MEIGRIISKLRMERHLNQRDFAAHLGVSNGAVGMWETGKRQPDLDTINRIADFFGESTDYLLGRTEQRQSTVSTSSQDTIVLQRLKELLEEEPGIDFYSNVSHIPVNTLYQYANGDQNPNAYDLCKIVETLNTSADYLFGKSDVVHPADENSIKYSQDSFPYILWSEMDGNYLETELADILNVSISNIRKLLSGETEPSPQILFELAQLFHKSTDYLLGLSNDSREKNGSERYPFQMDADSIQRIQEVIGAEFDEYDAKELGITYDELYMLFHYGFIPHIDVLQKLCTKNHISADYLLNLSDSKLSINITQESNEDEILKNFRKLDKLYKNNVSGFISEQLLQQERDKYMKSSVAADNSLQKTGTDDTGK